MPTDKETRPPTAQPPTAAQEDGRSAPNRGSTEPPGPAQIYFALSPAAARVPIPKELYVALHDFLRSGRNAGSITVHFRAGDIVCVEALTRKTYRSRI